MNSIWFVHEFMDVFSIDLFDMPSNCSIAFDIDVEPGIKPISISPYRIAPMKLKEEIQNLLGKRFIRPSVSPWDDPVLFVKKENGYMRMCVNFRQLKK